MKEKTMSAVTIQGLKNNGHPNHNLFKFRWKGASDIGFVDVESGNEEELQHAIASQGPCSIAIDASHESFQFYSTGVYREPECDPGMLDHGVLLVGYGQE